MSRKEILYCRSTGMGARTYATILRQPASIQKANHSKTGNHWVEELLVGEGGLIFVTDISNSGKHSCYCIPKTDLKKVERDFGRLPCGLGADLHKK